MEKVKVTIENETGEKSVTSITLNNDETMDVKVDFVPKIDAENTEFYANLTFALIELLSGE